MPEDARRPARSSDEFVRDETGEIVAVGHRVDHDVDFWTDERFAEVEELNDAARAWCTVLMDWGWLGTPLDVRPLFPVERGALVDLLAALEPDEWSRATVCPGWAVRDVAGHILHDYVRRLSADRDRHPGPEFGSDETLAAFLARSNEDFVRTARQISPRLMIDLLVHLGTQLDVEWSSREMGDPAGAEVSWAAPGLPAPVWLDVAREYSELWVHQQQIRDAVGRPGGTEPWLLHPVLDTFMRALPQTLHGTSAPVGATVRVRVPGPAGVSGPPHGASTAGAWTTTRLV
jgi:uncharacterized protein (TIGR03083 family)